MTKIHEIARQFESENNTIGSTIDREKLDEIITKVYLSVEATATKYLHPRPINHLSFGILTEGFAPLRKQEYGTFAALNEIYTALAKTQQDTQKEKMQKYAKEILAREIKEYTDANKTYNANIKYRIDPDQMYKSIYTNRKEDIDTKIGQSLQIMSEKNELNVEQIALSAARTAAKEMQFQTLIEAISYIAHAKKFEDYTYASKEFLQRGITLESLDALQSDIAFWNNNKPRLITHHHNTNVTDERHPFFGKTLTQITDSDVIDLINYTIVINGEKETRRKTVDKELLEKSAAKIIYLNNRIGPPILPLHNNSRSKPSLNTYDGYKESQSSD